MRVKLPDVQTGERWKRGAVKEVKTKKEADDLVAQGGVLLEDEEETAEKPKGEAKKK